MDPIQTRSLFSPTPPLGAKRSRIDFESSELARDAIASSMPAEPPLSPLARSRAGASLAPLSPLHNRIISHPLGGSATSAAFSNPLRRGFLHFLDDDSSSSDEEPSREGRFPYSQFVGGAASSAAAGDEPISLLATDRVRLPPESAAIGSAPIFPPTHEVRVLSCERISAIAAEVSPPRSVASLSRMAPDRPQRPSAISDTPSSRLISSKRAEIVELDTGIVRTIALEELSRGNHAIVFSSPSALDVVVKATYKLSTTTVERQLESQCKQYFRIKNHCQTARILNNPLKDGVILQSRIDGIPLSVFREKFSERQMLDLKEHLDVFISEYKEDHMLDLLPANLLASNDRIINIDLDEGLEKFDGIHMLRMFFIDRYSRNDSSNIDQAIELLTYLKEKSLDVYKIFMGEKSAIPTGMEFFHALMAY